MAAATAERPSITLYTAQTPNGIKISILLEELGLPFKVYRVDLSAAEQKEPWFLAINPNGRIPALTDTFSDGKSISLFESGSIMQYLVEQYDTEHKLSYPQGSRESYEVNSWLFFLNAGVGPMQGQANHFTHYAPEKIRYGIYRYQNETRRLYMVLDSHLKETGSLYLVGSKCTIADIAHWGWIAGAGYAGINMAEFPTLKEWYQRMLKRDGVENGRNIPDKQTLKNDLTSEDIDQEAAKGQKWILEQQQKDAKK